MPKALAVTFGAKPSTFFYRLQMLTAFLVGIGLVFLPASIVESPEPTYTAETLMRRISGFDAALFLATANWVLADASKRDRLAASTFRTLNFTLAGVTVLVRCLRFLL